MLRQNCYISTQGVEGVKNFKYKGGSESILYTHVWSPLCNYIISAWTPVWIAPNLITFVGFAVHIIVHLLVIYYSPDLQQELPPWLCILMGLSLLTYQILDNCDGKQARATNSSSPLGMLFDHGCDTIATWIVTINTLAIFQIPSLRLQYYSVLLIGLIPFYFGMWSQYHVGSFKLGYVNAVDEGLVVGELIYFISAICGQQIWQKQIDLFGISYGETLLYASIVMAILQMVQFSRDLYQSVPPEKFSEGMKDHLCTGLLVLTFLSVDAFMGVEFLSNYMILFIYTMSFSWSKIIGHIQLAHITEDKFIQWQLSFIFICLSFIFQSIYYFLTGTYAINIVYMIIFNLALAFFSFAHLAYNVFNQMADILGIFIFRIGKKQDYLKISSKLHMDLNTPDGIEL